MTKLNEIYRCSVCGNIVELVHASVGKLVCCDKPMELLQANADDSGATEKHVPVIEKTEKGVRVKIGSVAHPMEPAHFIEWIEILADGQSYKKFLQPGDAPEAEFCISAAEITAREYCNLHGLWKA
ncbi:MAG: desulfoferrodoxin [Candidatus Peribacteraceae bacterium]|nr:desulfoferrodoxin [Candidatus Peribacteraceae bacterium]